MVAFSKIIAVASGATPVAPTQALTMQSFLTSSYTWTMVCASDRCQYQPLLSCKPTDPSCFASDTFNLTEKSFGAKNTTHILCNQTHKQCFHFFHPDDEPLPGLTINSHKQNENKFDASRNATDTRGHGNAIQHTLFPRVSRDQFFNCKSERGEQHDCITPSMCCSKSGCQAPPYGCPASEVVTGPDSMLDFVPPAPEEKESENGHGCDKHTGMCW